jgi:hypothetical protein
MAGGYQELYCDECGVEITWTPVVIDGRPYCCRDCAVGLECDCASGEPRLRDDSAPFWVGSVDGGVDSSYDVDYYAFD